MKSLYPHAKVHTTGHSLGGALAQITGVDLINAGFKVDSYTFGAPRLGNAEYLLYSEEMYSDVHHVVWH